MKEKSLSVTIGVPPVSLTATKSPSEEPSTTAVYVVLGSSPVVLLPYGFSVAVKVPAL